MYLEKDISEDLVSLTDGKSWMHLLQVDGNAIASFKGQPFAQLTFLQWLSMAVNRLTDLDGLVGAALESLSLSGWSVGFTTG